MVRQQGIQKIDGEVLMGFGAKHTLKTKVGEEIDVAFFEAKNHSHPPSLATLLL